MKKLVQGARSAGPYLLVELLLPGGSLIAAAMFVIAHRKRLLTRNPRVGMASEASA
jgi:hypothetical protein